MRSMTGFAREVLQEEDVTIVVEMKSVNHRYLDISFQMPSFLYPIENQLKKQIQQQVQRGKVSVSLDITGAYTKNQVVQTNWNLAKQYLEQLKELQNAYQLKGDITIDMLASFSDIFALEEKELDLSGINVKVQELMDSAVWQLNQMRQTEGKELANDLISRIQNIESKIKRLGERRNIVIIEYQERIISRIRQYLSHTSVYDETTILSEVALMAEKGDITEEITRIHSHLKQMRQIVKERDAKGRKLDFIVQELNRELNTIGSKSNDPWISEQIVYLKSETEKMKEQIQNLE
ncbi:MULTISPECIES: YicC/YloC family endoribonuclease [Gracilibacillus]|uniref:YicC/YloC family endoribonuclease n=1 Tax=Gracilibacillus TaxID=74385 RepID=UPI00082487BA|nr:MULTISPECIES: YicC/YloC family endoribonuclease [Gracilibacillus]